MTATCESWREVWTMLKGGNIDFVGQSTTYNLQSYVIWVAGIIGFIHGFVGQRFLYTFYWIFGSTILITLICLPSWPIWNRHPLKWLEPRPEDKEEEQAEKSKDKGDKGKKGDKKGKGKGGKKKLDPAPEKWGETWEQPREETGVTTIAEVAPKNVKWVYPISDESRRSFAGFLRCPVTIPQADSFFEKVRDGTEWSQPTLGKTGMLIPRKTAWMVQGRCKCTYRYGTVEVEAQTFPPWMNEIMRTYMPLCGLKPHEWPNSCNLNLYDDGAASVAWHTDDETLFQGKFQDIRIISVSLGQKRKFEMRLNWPEEGEDNVRRIMLGNGDLCTMEGMFQKHFQHRVPKEISAASDPRINLTWRYVVKHTPQCPAARKRPSF